jgi:hypothetical protein
MKNRFLTISLLAIMATMLVACSRSSDESQIRTAIDEMAQAIENRQPKQLLTHLAPSFQGQESIDRDGVRGMMAAQFVRNENIKVFLSGVRIAVNGQLATARFKATLTGAQGVLPERLQYVDVELEWWKDKKQWSVVRATWQPVFGDTPS